MQSPENKKLAEAFRMAFANAIEASQRIRTSEVADQIVNVITHQHRTHQQQFMGAIRLALTKYAEAGHDLRNEAAVEWAKEVAKLPNSDLRFPYL